ncbi:MAG: DNA repair protein RecO [Pseudomonadales bacterium]
MKIEKQPAFVLRAQSYKETSLLVDIFSRDHGRQKLIVRGAKSAKSSKASQRQPFADLFMGWQGKSDLKNLTEIDSAPSLLVNPANLVYGMYLNELLFYLLREADPHDALYDLYRSTLVSLQSEPLIEPVLRNFEFGLLAEMGYAIELNFDLDGVPINPEGQYMYLPDAGFRQEYSQTYGLIPGVAIEDLAENGLQSKAALKVAKILCRSHLDLLLAGRELKSRRWLLS